MRNAVSVHVSCVFICVKDSAVFQQFTPFVGDTLTLLFLLLSSSSCRAVSLALHFGTGRFLCPLDLRLNLSRGKGTASWARLRLQRVLFLLLFLSPPLL